MAVPTGMYDMKGASKVTGLTVSVMRAWEARYGWPRPSRMPNGYRVYTKGQVEDLKRVADHLRETGLTIRSLIDDSGCVRVPSLPGRGPANPPLPTAEAMAAGDQPMDAVVEAVRVGDVPLALRHIVASIRARVGLRCMLAACAITAVRERHLQGRGLPAPAARRVEMSVLEAVGTNDYQAACYTADAALAGNYQKAP